MTTPSSTKNSSNPSGCKFNIGDKVQYYSQFRGVFVQGIVCAPKENVDTIGQSIKTPVSVPVVWAYWGGKTIKGFCYESEVTLVEPAKPDYNDEEWI